jgi:hypothetical protein
MSSQNTTHRESLHINKDLEISKRQDEQDEGKRAKRGCSKDRSRTGQRDRGAASHGANQDGDGAKVCIETECDMRCKDGMEVDHQLMKQGETDKKNDEGDVVIQTENQQDPGSKPSQRESSDTRNIEGEGASQVQQSREEERRHSHGMRSDRWDQGRDAGKRDQGLEKREKGPEKREKGPEKREKGPEKREKGPEKREEGPEKREKGPEKDQGRVMRNEGSKHSSGGHSSKEKRGYKSREARMAGMRLEWEDKLERIICERLDRCGMRANDVADCIHVCLSQDHIPKTSACARLWQTIETHCRKVSAPHACGMLAALGDKMHDRQCRGAQERTIISNICAVLLENARMWRCSDVCSMHLEEGSSLGKVEADSNLGRGKADASLGQQSSSDTHAHSSSGDDAQYTSTQDTQQQAHSDDGHAHSDDGHAHPGPAVLWSAIETAVCSHLHLAATEGELIRTWAYRALECSENLRKQGNHVEMCGANSVLDDAISINVVDTGVLVTVKCQVLWVTCMLNMWDVTDASVETHASKVCTQTPIEHNGRTDGETQGSRDIEGQGTSEIKGHGSGTCCSAGDASGNPTPNNMQHKDKLNNTGALSDAEASLNTRIDEQGVIRMLQCISKNWFEAFQHDFQSQERERQGRRNRERLYEVCLYTMKTRPIVWKRLFTACTELLNVLIDTESGMCGKFNIFACTHVCLSVCMYTVCAR